MALASLSAVLSRALAAASVAMSFLRLRVPSRLPCRVTLAAAREATFRTAGAFFLCLLVLCKGRWTVRFFGATTPALTDRLRLTPPMATSLCSR
eukprot:CAMPEP_0197426648 /NCGR_PEP_ID=MMETSP1170-20131217/35699_1 /TAXON_ID=54406 /ORGANISM="Sarcinochrysis sp, Strain CCMP770" /LENGTH=93 /DNA_ID=CAMNT_0042954295 /DNA_START=287 /DNA_END=564 /DNA_ORIENTATION=+